MAEAAPAGPPSDSPATSRLAAFYALLLTQTFSLIGSRMTSVAVGIFIFRETAQAAPLLLISFFNELPGMLGGGLAGVLVDRWNRKLVMILADLGQAAGSVLLIASFLSGAFQLWHVYAVAFLQGVFATLQGPAESATVTLMVPEGHRDRANAIAELGFPLASVLAPILTGLVYTSIGVAGVLGVDLGTFVIAAAVLLVLTIPQPPATEQGAAGRGGMLSEWRTGFAFLRRHRPLLIFIVYFAFCSFRIREIVPPNSPVPRDIINLHCFDAPPFQFGRARCRPHVTASLPGSSGPLWWGGTWGKAKVCPSVISLP